MIKEFKEFIMRGSVLDLAVGVIIGSAFTGIVNQVVDGLITPLIGLVISFFTDGENLNDAMSVLDWPVRKGVTFKFGDVISAIITFLITAFVLFLIVKAANKAKSFGQKEEEEAAEIVTTESLLTEIRDLLEAQEEKTTTVQIDATKQSHE